MADNDKKRYYWLKLKKDFFHQHQLKVLKTLPNGRLYALIYLELLAESTSHNGELRYSKTLPYDVVTLAAVIDEDKDNVQAAIEVLCKLELMEILDDGTIYLREIQRLIGSESGSAERKRLQRERMKDNLKKIECDNVTNESQKSHLESRVKSIDIRDKRLDIDDDIQIYSERLLEAGTPIEIINQALNIYLKYQLNDSDIFIKIIDTLTNEDIFNKEAYISQIIRNS